MCTIIHRIWGWAWHLASIIDVWGYDREFDNVYILQCGGDI